MINTTNEFKKACNSSSIKYREYIILKGTNEKIDVVTEIYKTAYKDTHFIGTFNLGYVKFKTENNIDYKKKEFSLYKEVNNMPLYMGNYIVTEVKDNNSKEEVEVTAFDYGIKFAQKYYSELDYASNKVKLFDVLKECCTKCDVLLKNTSIENGNFIVDSNQFPNSTYGDVISAIAQISGNFATINNENQLEFIFKTQTNEIIEDYIELLDKRDSHPITSVSLGMSQVEGENVVLKDENLIAKYGEHWLILNDNPFAYTEEKRKELITDIFNKVKGFEYSAFESKYAFKPYLSLGDLIQFRNKEGKLVNSIILETNSKYDDITLIAKSITDAEVKYQNPKTVEEIAKQTEIISNKALQEVTITNKKVEKNNEQITEIKTTTENITNRVSDVTETTDTLTGEVTNINKNVSELEQTVKGLTNTVTQQGGSNLLLNSSGLFDNEHWEGTIVTLTNTEIQNNFVAKACFNLQKGTMKQNIAATNGAFYIGFKYQKNIELAKCEIKINGVLYQLTESKLTQQDIYVNVDDHNIAIEIISDTNNSCYIGDIIVVQGAKQEWSANMNEIYTSTVKIGIGLEITSNTVKTKLLANADGVRIVNTTNNNVVAEFTDRGMTTNELTANTSRIAGILIQEINNQTWISKL